MGTNSPVESASHLLRSAYLRAEDLWSVAVSDAGLTPRQKVLLEMAKRHPGSTLSFLADQVRLERQTAAEMVHRLAGRGLLECRDSKYDKRAYSIWVTDQSLELLASVAHLDDQIEAEILAPLPTEYRPLFMKCLRLMDQAAISDDARDAAAESALPELVEKTHG